MRRLSPRAAGAEGPGTHERADVARRSSTRDRSAWSRATRKARRSLRRGAGMCGEGFYAGARSAASVRSVLTGMRTMALGRAPESRRPAGSGGPDCSSRGSTRGLCVAGWPPRGRDPDDRRDARDARSWAGSSRTAVRATSRRLEIVEGAEADAVSPALTTTAREDVVGARRSESPLRERRSRSPWLITRVSRTSALGLPLFTPQRHNLVILSQRPCSIARPERVDRSASCGPTR